MKAAIFVFIISFFLISSLAYAGSQKTWSNIGKGLAIYEGAKVLTGSQGNIIDDVTGGLKPKGDGSSGGYQDGYKNTKDVLAELSPNTARSLALRQGAGWLAAGKATAEIRGSGKCR